MRALIQRVSRASVVVDNITVGSIDRGILLLLGVGQGDDEKDLDYLERKILALRIFPDEAGKMNLSAQEIKGELLIISQFTLFADTRKGNRPSFIKAGAPEMAKSMYENLILRLRKSGLKIECGVFAADMSISLVNEGPVTIMIDTKEE